MASPSDFKGGGGAWTSGQFEIGAGRAYYNKEKKDYEKAFGLYGVASAEEQKMMQAQLEAMQQAYDDRKNTRNLILAQMGFKVGKDEKGQQTLVPLSNEERKAIMSEAEKSKSEASSAYMQRATSAAKGETKLPSFLKKDIDHQKVKESALLEEMLGPEALQSTAGKQALEAMMKKEEQVRQQLQEQDLASAPGKAMGLSGQIEAGRGQRIGQMEQLPNLNQNIIAGRGSILNQYQNNRLSMLKKAYGDLEAKRSMIQSFYTLGGMVGGAAATAANNRKKGPEAQVNNYGYNGYSGQPMYDPNADTSGSYWIDGKEYDSTY